MRLRMAPAAPSVPLTTLSREVHEVPVPPETTPVVLAREMLKAEMATRKSPAWIVPPLPPPVVVRAVVRATDGEPPLIAPAARLPTNVMGTDYPYVDIPPAVWPGGMETWRKSTAATPRR